jgi:hypothetical protein
MKRSLLHLASWRWMKAKIKFRVEVCFFFFGILMFLFPQVLCHILCFLMYSKLILVDVGLWE